MPAQSNPHASDQALGREFYRFLSANGLLEVHPKFDSETEWEIKEQVNVQGYFAMRMLSLFENRDHDYFKLCRCMDSYVPSGMPKTFEKESKLIPFALLANYALSQYENLKRCLLFALDGGKMSLRMTSRTTYGKIIDKLRQHGMDLRLVDAMDNELRNIIAHGNWYVKEGKFTYLAKEKTYFMPYDDLKGRTSKFVDFANGFFRSYWTDHVREEHTKFALKKKIEETLQAESGTF